MPDNRVIIDFTVTGNGDVEIKKVEKAVAELGKSAETNLSKATEAFGLMAGGLAAAGAAMAALTKQALDAGDRVNTLAERVGVTTDFFQEMEFAASQLNIENSDLTQGLTILNRTIGEAAIGQETAKRAFEQLGLKVTDLHGRLKPTNVVFNEAVKALEGVKNSSERAALAQDLFGKVGSKLAVIAGEGTGKIQSLSEQAHALGIVMSADLVKQADATNDKLSVLYQTIKGNLYSALITLAGPAISKVAEGLAKLAALAGRGAQQIAAIFTDANPAARAELLAKSIEQINQKTRDLETGTGFWARWYRAAGTADEQIAKNNANVAQMQKELDGLNQKMAQNSTVTTSAAGAARALSDEQKKLIEQGVQLAKQLEEKGDPAVKYQDEMIALEAALQAKKISNDQFRAAEIQADLQYKEETGAKAVEEADFLIEQNHRVVQDYVANSGEILATNDARLQQILKSENLSTQQRQKIQKQYNESSRQIEQARIQAAQGALSGLAQFQNAKTKEIAAVAKAAAIANTTIETYKSATSSYAALAGIPFVGPALGFAAAAAAIAAGLANVAQISGVQLASGITEVPPGFANDTFPARLTSGERVVDNGTNEDLKAMTSSWPIVIGLLGSMNQKLDMMQQRIVVNVGTRTIVDEVRRGAESGRPIYA